MGSPRQPPAARVRLAVSSHSLGKGMLRTGIPALADLGGAQAHRLAHVLRQRGVALHELGAEPLVQAEHVGKGEDLAVAGGGPPGAERGGGPPSGGAARWAPGRTILVWSIICTSVAERFVSSPASTWFTESPTSSTSTPAASSSRANNAS